MTFHNKFITAKLQKPQLGKCHKSTCNYNLLSQPFQERPVWPRGPESSGSSTTCAHNVLDTEAFLVWANGRQRHSLPLPLQLNKKLRCRKPMLAYVQKPPIKYTIHSKRPGKGATCMFTSQYKSNTRHTVGTHNPIVHVYIYIYITSVH